MTNLAMTKLITRCLVICLALFMNVAIAGVPLLIQVSEDEALAGRLTEKARLHALREHRNNEKVWLVSVDENALQSPTLNINISGVMDLEITRTRFEERPPFYSWIGKVKGGGDAFFSLHEGHISGSFDTYRGRYVLELINGKLHALIRVNPAEPPGDPKAPTLQAPQSQLDAKPAAGKTETAAGPAIIDILIAYTPAAAASLGDFASVVNRTVDEANQAFRNSGNAVTVRWLDFYQSSLPELASLEQMVETFRQDAVAKQRRLKANADVAILLVKTGGGKEACGAAYPGPLLPATHGFAVVRTDCLSSYYTLAHEIGHLIGADHEQDAPAPPANKLPYAHGWFRCPAAGPSMFPSFHTLMTTMRTCKTSTGDLHTYRILYFSNPAILDTSPPTPPYVPIGDASVANNARAISEYAYSLSLMSEQIMSEQAAQLIPILQSSLLSDDI